MRTVDEYMALPYTIQITRDAGEEFAGWFARVAELPGCMTQADSFEELGPMIEDAMRAWIETALEDGQAVPEPRPAGEYSGKFVIRVPRSLHRQLAEGAEQDGVSLNTFVNVALARTLGLESTIVPEEDATHGPAPSWPRLSASATRALAAAGLQVEAQQIDEQLFGNWLNNMVEQVEAAAEGGYVQDALSHADQIRQALSRCCDASPLMQVFHRMVTLMEGQLEQNARLREGLVQSFTQYQLSQQVSARTQSVVRHGLAPVRPGILEKRRVHEERASYRIADPPGQVSDDQS